MKQKNVNHIVDKGTEDLVVSYAFYGHSILINSYFLNLVWPNMKKSSLSSLSLIEYECIDILGITCRTSQVTDHLH